MSTMIMWVAMCACVTAGSYSYDGPMYMVSSGLLPFGSGTSNIVLPIKRIDTPSSNAIMELGHGSEADIIDNPPQPGSLIPNMRYSLAEQDDVYGTIMTAWGVTGGLTLATRETVTSPIAYFNVVDMSIVMPSFKQQKAEFSDGKYVMFEFEKMTLGCFGTRSAPEGGITTEWTTDIPASHNRGRWSTMYSAAGTMIMIDGVSDPDDSSFSISDGATVVDMHTGDISILQFPGGQQKDALVVFTRSGRLLLINGVLRSSMERSMSISVVDVKSMSTSVIPLNFRGGDTEFIGGHPRSGVMWYTQFSQSASGGAVAIPVFTASTNISGHGPDILLVDTDTHDTSFHSGCIQELIGKSDATFWWDAAGVVAGDSFSFVDVEVNATMVDVTCIGVPVPPVPVTTGDPAVSSTSTSSTNTATVASTTSGNTPDGTSVNGISGSSSIYPVLAVMFLASVVSLNV